MSNAEMPGNLRHRSNAEGRFAVQVQPLFWNLRR